MSYVRFSDNTTQSSNSYKLFSEQQSKTLEQYKQSPQDLQRQQEKFQHELSQNSNNSTQMIHSQTPIPNFDDENKNKQLELRQKQHQLQQERYQSSIPTSMDNYEPESKPKPVVENFSNMSINDLQHKFPNTNEVYINEIHRLLQHENSLTLEQASNLAQCNGCGVDGYSDMCPSKPIQIENYKQKGDCVGENCDVTFSTQKESYMSPVDKLKSLDITFYTNAGCGFCQQTKQMFEESGINLSTDINISSNLPSGARGFPHFESRVSGKSHTGFPRSIERLYDLLS